MPQSKAVASETGTPAAENVKSQHGSTLSSRGLVLEYLLDFSRVLSYLLLDIMISTIICNGKSLLKIRL